MDTKDQMHTEKLRQAASAAEGGGYWKSLDELTETDEYKKWLEDEFPNRESIPDVDRRSILKFMGASAVLAGLVGCRNLPQEKIVPYVKAPEDRILGKPQYYASAYTHAGYATGVLVLSHEGRPTKIEGNPDHPASLGSVDSFALSSILPLYDPDRSVPLQKNGLPSTWDLFLTEARSVLASKKGDGSRIRLLTGSVTSPSTQRAIDEFMAAFPGAIKHRYESVNRDNVAKGADLAFGSRVETIFDFAQADRIVSFDADFLAAMPGSTRYARDFASR